MMTHHIHPFAVITGASSGIGFELAKCCVARQFDILIAADEPQIHGAVAKLRTYGTRVDGFEVDLSTPEGAERLYAATKGRPVTALLANSGGRLDRTFMDQEFDEARKLIDANVTGSLCLIQKIGRDMRSRGEGRILITGAMPGTHQAINTAIEALLDSFAFTLRAELKDHGVSVTSLMPGALAQPPHLERSDRQEPKAGTVGTTKCLSTDEMAKLGFEAMMCGQSDPVHNRALRSAPGAAPRPPFLDELSPGMLASSPS